MIAEGTETPGGEPGGASAEGRGSEGDLLAERRARRAAELGDAGLVGRAEVAEATVQALETNVASLRRRLAEAETERRRISQLADAERASLAEREHELRGVKQREYAEQQLRVEAEDRRIDLERQGRARVDRMNVALLASQRETRELAGRLESVQRELAEAEQAAAAERSSLLADLRSVTERGLETRIAVLEGRAEELRRGLESERAARERAERLLEDTRRGHRRMEVLLGELKGVVSRLRNATSEDLAPAREQASAPAPVAGSFAPARPAPPVARSFASARPAPPVARSFASAPALVGENERRGEMADALAAAVERLRARVASVDEVPAPQEARQEQSGAVSQARVTEPIAKPPHKHSMSLLTRLRLRRKHRHERRSTAAGPPTIQS